MSLWLKPAQDTVNTGLVRYSNFLVGMFMSYIIILF